MEYSIVYSSRRTLAITVKEGEVIVRSPYGVDKKRIENAVDKRDKISHDADHHDKEKHLHQKAVKNRKKIHLIYSKKLL